MQAFDETPPTPVCRKVELLIDSVRNPRPPNNPPYLVDPNTHFIYSRVAADYPDDLYNLVHSGNISSGWISEIECFWAADKKSLYLFDSDLKHVRNVNIPFPVICVGFIEGFIVVSYQSSIGLFSFPDLEPLKSSYSIPPNVSVTSIQHGIVGCNDNTLRKITLNRSKCHCSISGFLSLHQDDPVVLIIETENFYVSLSLNFSVSLFSKSQLTKLATFSQVKNILTLWCPSGDQIFAIDQNTVLYSFHYNGLGSLSAQTECQLLERRQFQNILFSNGFLTGIDSSRPSFDMVFTARFGHFPVYTMNQRLGTIHSIGESFLSSSVLLFTTSGIYSLSEKLSKNEGEEYWRFANVLTPYWDLSITSLPSELHLGEVLNEYFLSDFEHISALSKYVLTIIDDIRVLEKSEFEKLFSDIRLRDLFTMSKTETFSRLRKISFEIRFKNQEQIDHPPTELELLICQANSGDQIASQKALNIITSSFQTLPPCFPIYCNFMLQHRYYKELIEAIISWANSVLPDDNALAFENANFPTNNTDEVASYHLRLRIYEQMNGFLEIATTTDDVDAKQSLKFALNLPNEVFQRFVLQYLEDNCPSEEIINFTYPEMIDQMKMIRSRHLPTLFIYNGLNRNAFDIYVENASLDSDLPILDRIDMLLEAQKLYPNDEGVQKLVKCANLLTEFISNNPVPQNLFARDFFEINDFLVESGEYTLALEAMKIFHERRFDVLEKFLEISSPDEVKDYILNEPVFTQSEIATQLYYIKGKQAFDFMFDCQIENKYIFEILCELWRGSDFRYDVSIITNALERSGPINREVRQEVADMLCEIIVELDANNDHECADSIRHRLEHCFLDQTFNDINDF